MQIRKFWLVNSLGEKYELLDENHFLYTPQGLGFSKTYSLIQLGDVQEIDSEQFNMIDISGDIVFTGSTNSIKYQKYYEFIQFIKNRPLELHYQTPNSLTDYFCNVVISSVEKSEINDTSVLQTPIVFHRLTQWLTSEYYSVTLSNQASGTGKYYNLVRPYHYAGNTLQDVPLTNNGTDSVGFTFEIDGDVQNPQFTMSQDGVIYGSCKLVGTFDFVKINSADNEEEIYLENDGSVLSNPSSYQDLTIANGKNYVTFVKLAVGNTIFNFTCGNIDTFNGTITIRFRSSYVSV